MSVAFKIGQVDPSYMELIQKVSTIVGKISGNKLGEKQLYMIETRIKKRMSELGMNSPAIYSSYIDTHYKEESVVLVGLITTHHTYFFREFVHFEILKNALPQLVIEAKKRPDRTIKIWSAACSKGHEVYSLAMFLNQCLLELKEDIKFKILGSDIDVESVKIAQNGVYHQNEVKEIPMVFLKDNWAYGTGEIANFAKIKMKIKNNCQFKVGNLLNVDEIVGTEKFDAIFCRNVFIYFAPDQVKEISEKLMSKLHSHGILFSGVSEPLSNFKLELDNLGPSVYQLKGTKTETKVETNVLPIHTIPTKKPKALLRVMCIDDSSTILTILKKVLTAEHGFEVVATAINGKDAMEKMKTVQVDLVTLDIHMPEMNGLEYLEKNFNYSHPPVMMISSASREDSDTALKALKFGASDYVEKPTLSNIEEKGDEIRNKLRILSTLKENRVQISQMDQEAQKTFVIKDCATKQRLVFASLSQMEILASEFREFKGAQPATIIFVDGVDAVLETLMTQYKYKFAAPTSFIPDNLASIIPGQIYFADVNKTFGKIAQERSNLVTSVLVYGNATSKIKMGLNSFRNKEIILEDIGEHTAKSPLYSMAKDVVPSTSFAYLSNKFLSEK